MGRFPKETVMVAAHVSDLTAAAEVDMWTVYVQAPEEDHVGEGCFEPESITAYYKAEGVIPSWRNNTEKGFEWAKHMRMLPTIRKGVLLSTQK